MPLIEHSRIRFARLNSGLATIRNLGLEGSFFANWQSTLAAKTLTLKVPTWEHLIKCQGNDALLD